MGPYRPNEIFAGVLIYRIARDEFFLAGKIFLGVNFQLFGKGFIGPQDCFIL